MTYPEIHVSAVVGMRQFQGVDIREIRKTNKATVNVMYHDPLHFHRGKFKVVVCFVNEKGHLKQWQLDGSFMTVDGARKHIHHKMTDKHII